MAEIFPLIDEVHRIARRAGAVIMGYFGQSPEVREKTDSTPVTEADEAADRLIVAALEALTRDIPVISEEGVASGRIPAIDAGRFWLVDPLDGTKEFIAGRDEFTVNIALIDDFAPVLGVIHAPARGESYYATAQGGAHHETEGRPPAPIAARPMPNDGVVAVVSRSHRSPEVDAYLAKIKVKSETSMGSSFKFCLIASGKADLYPRFGRTMEWDTAAGHAILEAAGGSLRTLGDGPFRYGKPGFSNPPFVAQGHVS
jgi:3'(2'), 5'-bisphosphate nucleotidase